MCQCNRDNRDPLVSRYVWKSSSARYYIGREHAELEQRICAVCYPSALRSSRTT